MEEVWESDEYEKVWIHFSFFSLSGVKSDETSLVFGQLELPELFLFVKQQ